MSRFVVPRRPGLAGGEPPDDFSGRLTKYIPAGIVSLYTIAISGLIASKPDPAIAPKIVAGLMAFFLVITFLYFWLKAPHGVVRNAHMVASPVAFVAWAYPLGAALLGHWFVGWIAIVGQAIAAGLAWLLAPEEPKPGATTPAPTTPTPTTR